MDALNGLTNFLDEINIPFNVKHIKINNYNYNFLIFPNHNFLILYTNEWNSSIKYHLALLKLHFFKIYIDTIYINKNYILYRFDIIKSKLQSIFNLNTSIYARKTQIIEIDNQQAYKFIVDNGLYCPCYSKYKIGLTYNGILVMLALFSKKRNMKREDKIFNSYELVRIISLKNTNIIGGIDKLVNYFIKSYNPDDIMTYIDLNWYRSNSFSKLNFKLLGITCTKITPSTRVCKLDDLRNTNLGSVKFIKYIKKI